MANNTKKNGGKEEEKGLQILTTVYNKWHGLPEDGNIAAYEIEDDHPDYTPIRAGVDSEQKIPEEEQKTINLQFGINATGGYRIKKHQVRRFVRCRPAFPKLNRDKELNVWVPSNWNQRLDKISASLHQISDEQVEVKADNLRVVADITLFNQYKKEVPDGRGDIVFFTVLRKSIKSELTSDKSTVDTSGDEGGVRDDRLFFLITDLASIGDEEYITGQTVVSFAEERDYEGWMVTLDPKYVEDVTETDTQSIKHNQNEKNAKCQTLALRLPKKFVLTRQGIPELHYFKYTDLKGNIPTIKEKKMDDKNKIKEIWFKVMTGYEKTTKTTCIGHPGVPNVNTVRPNFVWVCADFQSEAFKDVTGDSHKIKNWKTDHGFVGQAFEFEKGLISSPKGSPPKGQKIEYIVENGFLVDVKEVKEETPSPGQKVAETPDAQAAQPEEKIKSAVKTNGEQGNGVKELIKDLTDTGVLSQILKAGKKLVIKEIYFEIS